MERVHDLASSETGLCTQVRNLEKDEGATIDQGTCRDGSHQKFKFLAGPDSDTFKFQAIRSGKCLVVINDRRVVQESCTENGQSGKFDFATPREVGTIGKSAALPTVADSVSTCPGLTGKKVFLFRRGSATTEIISNGEPVHRLGSRVHTSFALQASAAHPDARHGVVIHE